MMEILDLIYDWNTEGGAPQRPSHLIEVNDETLRDGLQSPSVRHPSPKEKRRILHPMDGLGTASANLGYPGASRRALDDVVALATEIRAHRLSLRANCAGRTVEADILPIAEAQQRSGLPIRGGRVPGEQPAAPVR